MPALKLASPSAIDQPEPKHGSLRDALMTSATPAVLPTDLSPAATTATPRSCRTRSCAPSAVTSSAPTTRSATDSAKRRRRRRWTGPASAVVATDVISFIWSAGNPLPAGTGGSENYTVGQVRELNRRGEPAQVVTIGLDDARRPRRVRRRPVPFAAQPASRRPAGRNGHLRQRFPAARRPDVRRYQILHNPPPIRDRSRPGARHRGNPDRVAHRHQPVRRRAVVGLPRRRRRDHPRGLSLRRTVLRDAVATPAPRRPTPHPVRRPAEPGEGHLHTAGDAAHRRHRAGPAPDVHRDHRGCGQAAGTRSSTAAPRATRASASCPPARRRRRWPR